MYLKKLIWNVLFCDVMIIKYDKYDIFNKKY